MRFLIILGMSGAGKTTAMHTLEDLNFYCVDNLPPDLITIFYNLCERSSDNNMSNVALVVDIRAENVGLKLKNALGQLDFQNKEYEILFLDSDNATLAKRYKETRRKHPMILEAGNDDSLVEAIKSERRLLSEFKESADYLIDSSIISVAQMKERIVSLFCGSVEKGFSVTAMSFGFKYGFPPEADLVFDVRCLINPYYDENLKHKTGLEEEVSSYVMKDANSKGLLERQLDLIDYSLPLYMKEGKTQLVIAVGCTGGKHRSVTFTQEIFKHLTEKNINVNVYHRDIKRV